MPFSSNIFEDLKRSNRLWAAKVNETDPNFFNESAKGQHPKVLWVGW
jgi:carbonic anhydrase